MEKRSLGTGIYRVLRFNWHFYALAALGFGILTLAVNLVQGWMRFLLLVILFLGLLAVALSLLVTLYVYDLSALYRLSWLDDDGFLPMNNILNIHAGYDETTELLLEKYPNAQLKVFDFYDPQKHTEISIKRARRLFPAVPGTIRIQTDAIPIGDAWADAVMLIFAAHEIRDNQERVRFFKECGRVLKPKGKIIIVEHLRDLPNALAYNLGVFHFHSNRVWRNTFSQSGMKLTRQSHINPFVTVYILCNNGNTSSDCR